MPSLIVTSGTLAGQVFSFSDNAVVGRGQYSDVRLNDPTVSRRHALFRRDGGHYFLHDQGSANGTLHKGERITDAAQLRDGDELQFGEIKTIYRSADSDQPSLPSIAAVNDTATRARGTLDAQISVAEPKATPGMRDVLARLKLFGDLGTLARSQQELREQLDLALAAIQTAFPQASHLAIYRRIAGSEHLAVLAQRNSPEGETVFAQIEGFLREALRLQHGLMVVDQADRDALGARLRAASVPASVLGVPLRLGGDVLGVLYLDSAKTGQAWRLADQEMFAAIAGQLAWIICAAQTQSPERAIEAHDLALARRIQQRFLPQSPPSLPGYRFADSYSAARVIGGDYYDFFQFNNGYHGLVVADVSGKAVSGALYMARLSVQVRMLAKHLAGPVELLTALNRKLAQELEPGMFVTMIAASLDPDSGKMKLANAGHPAPLARDADGSVHDLGAEGALPLGAMSDTMFEQYTVQLEPGGCVLFYTDGLDEAHNAQRELFGKSRVVQTLSEHGGTAQSALDALLAELARFTVGEIQSDDLTLVTLSRDRPA
ncbi:MAG TPA: SpoIIE family protein phosphatase [Rudaea sp.]|nr:SpoIIE family protein phosphatase [Rudaea sp.]